MSPYCFKGAKKIIREVTGLHYCGRRCGCRDGSKVSKMWWFPPGSQVQSLPNWIPSWMNGAHTPEVWDWLRKNDHTGNVFIVTPDDDMLAIDDRYELCVTTRKDALKAYTSDTPGAYVVVCSGMPEKVLARARDLGLRPTII